MTKPVVEAPPTFRKAKQPRQRFVEWDLRLYVAESTLQIGRRLSQSRRLCEKHLAGHYRIEIVDLVKNPQFAHDNLSSGRANVNQQAIRSAKCQVRRRWSGRASRSLQACQKRKEIAKQRLFGNYLFQFPRGRTFRVEQAREGVKILRDRWYMIAPIVIPADPVDVCFPSLAQQR